MTKTQRTQAFISLSLFFFIFSLRGWATPLPTWPISFATVPTQSDTVLQPATLFDTACLQLSPSLPEAPTINLNKQAAAFVTLYLQKNSHALSKIGQRSQRYFSIIETIFRKHDLPLELKYLAVVESELKRTAVSRVGAAGPWQLMPATARELGLKVSAKADERKHYYKSTDAAAQYLKTLYAMFDDWLLVIAAYNSGPGVVYKAIRQSGSRNFWRLQQFLPAETRGHVKRYIGIHYFFEEKGSATTLTKSENSAYTKKLEAFYAAQMATPTMPPTETSVVISVPQAIEVYPLLTVPQYKKEK